VSQSVTHSVKQKHVIPTLSQQISRPLRNPNKSVWRGSSEDV